MEAAGHRRLTHVAAASWLLMLASQADVTLFTT